MCVGGYIDCHSEGEKGETDNRSWREEEGLGVRLA